MSEHLSDETIRALWRFNGGDFHGPRIETGTMPEKKLLPFIRTLVVSGVIVAPVDPKAVRAEFKQWFVENVFDLNTAPIGGKQFADQWASFAGARGLTNKQRIQAVLDEAKDLE